MDDRTAKAWNEAARHVLRRMPRNREAEERDGDVDWFDPYTFGIHVASVRKRIGHHHASRVEVTRAAVEAVAGKRTHDPSGTLLRPEARAVRAIVVGYAFVTHGGAMLPAHERLEALDLMDGVQWPGMRGIILMERDMHRHAEAPAPAPPPHASNAIRFRFSWMQAGRRGKAPANVAGTGDAMLRDVPVSQAPVVARLSTPGANRLELRLVDGILHRPILSPGTWSPIGLDALAEAAEAGTPWRDNPFTPYHSDPYGPVQGAAEHWPPETDVSTPDDEARRREALEACLRLAGRIILVDGIAYRATRPPRLVVGLTGAASIAPHVDRGPRLAWAFPGGPRSDGSQSTLSPRGNYPLGHCIAPWLRGGESDMAVSFPLGSDGAAKAFLGNLQPALEHWHGASGGDPGAPVEILDHDAFPDEPDALEAAMEEVRRLLDVRSPAMPVDTPFFDEAEALSPDDCADLAVPKGWKEDAAERASRTAIATVAALAAARRAFAGAPSTEWLSFSP